MHYSLEIKGKKPSITAGNQYNCLIEKSVSLYKTKKMTTITGTYYNGQLKLARPFKTKKPVKVTVTFEEELNTPLKLSEFSFLESQELMKNYNGSFSDEVIEERRKAI